MFSFELLLDAIVLGLLVGCFYAAVSIGLSVSFGLLDVPHVAHPALLVLAAYGTYMLNQWGVDPILAGLAITPIFFLIGIVTYRLYYETFERRGSDAAVRGIAFFFGIAFIIEVAIILMFGVDQRTVQAPYIGKSIDIGDMRIPMRLLVAFAVALTLTLLLTLYLARTFLGRAIRAVAQDEMALRLMGANPMHVKQWAFGIATAVLGLAGALLIIVSPVEPTLDRAYIGRTFCVVVMAGLGSMTGTLVAAIILGIAESIVLTLYGASWAPAISFAMLLAVLAVRPQGLFGR
jgi:branched-chain amino acid transport system permease protein